MVSVVVVSMVVVHMVVVHMVVVHMVVQHGVGTVECVVPCNSALHVEYKMEHGMGHSVV